MHAAWRRLVVDWLGTGRTSRGRRRHTPRRGAGPGRTTLEVLEPRIAPAGITLVQTIGTVVSGFAGEAESSLLLRVPAGHAVTARDTIIVELALNPGATS